MYTYKYLYTRLSHKMNLLSWVMVKKSLQNNLQPILNTLFSNQHFTENHLTLFCRRLTSRCIMYISVPISKQIIYSPTTFYTSLYILPMILDTSQVSKKKFLLNSSLPYNRPKKQFFWHNKSINTF